MSPLTRLIFHPSDDPLLRREVDDNQKIEPVWYIPIIPMVLVNGAEGIGTGWRTKIPNYNPRDIIENIYLMLDGNEPKSLKPWYKNFRGCIEDLGEQRYVTSGVVAITDNDEIEITELPVGTWTQVYKENVLETLLHGSDKVKAAIQDYKEYSTDTTVKFVVTPLPGQLRNMEQEGIHNILKLQSSIATSCMVVFDEFGGIKKFEEVEFIFREFYAIRMRMYAKRKEYLESSLEAEATRLDFQAKFIMEKCAGKLVVENKQRKALVEELLKKGYPADPVKVWKEKIAKEMNDVEDENDTQEDEDSQEEETKVDSKNKIQEDPDKAFNNSSDVKNYDYLLGMSMWMLTLEKKNQLLKQRDAKMLDLKILRGKKPSDLWREDLDEFEKKLDQVEEKERKEEADTLKKVVPKTKGPRAKKSVISETLPSVNARTVEPTLTEHIKKVAQMKKTKERKIKAGEKTTPNSAGLNSSIDEKDEFDMMIEDNKKTLQDKIGNSPDIIAKKAAAPRGRKPAAKKTESSDGLIQTKLDFKNPPAKSRGKKIVVSDSDEDIKIDLDDSDSDIEFSKAVKTTPPRERIRRRAATTKKVCYKIDSDNEEVSSNSDQQLFDNDLIDKPKRKVHQISDSEDDDMKPVKPDKTSDELFDSLIENEHEQSSISLFDDSDIPIAKKMAAEKRKNNDDGGGNSKKVKSNKKR